MRDRLHLDTRITKAMHDLLAHKGRAALVVVGLALSLWGITTVLTAFWVLWHDLRENFVATVPPSLVLRTDGLDDARRADVVATLEALPAIDAVENRPLIGGRIALGSTWLPIVVSVVDDFDAVRVARFEPEAGDWPPADGALSIERDGRMLARLMGVRSSRASTDGHHQPATDPHTGAPSPLAPSTDILDGARLRFGGAPALAVPITGTVFDPGQAPSRMERMLYGYASRATVEAWGVPIESERLLLTLTGDPESAAEVRSAGHAVADAMRALDVEVHRWGIPDYEHPHAFQMRSVLAVLGALGALAFLLAGVLVHDLVSTLLADQVRQIGILKALGAGTGTLVRTYLLAMSSLGFGAAIVAVPLGARSGMGLAHGIATFLNFEILTPGAPVGLLALCVVLGITHPALAALGPVVRTARITVRDALLRGESDGMPPRHAGHHSSRLPVAVALATRNAFRRRWRLVATVLTLAVGTSAFLAATNLRASLLYTAEVVEQTQLHDLRIVLGERLPTDGLERYVADLDGVTAVESWDARSIQLRAASDDGSEPMGVHGATILPAETEALAPRMLAGRWLRPGETDGIVVNQKLLADRPDLALGKPITLLVDDHTFTVRIVGVMKEFGGGTAYLDADGFEAMVGPDDGQRIVTVSLADRSWSARRALRQQLEVAIAHSELDVARLITTTMAAAIIRSHLDVIAYVLLAVALLMMLVSGLGMVSSLAVSVAERHRELGVLRAIGARTATVRGMLTLEAALIGSLGWIVAAAVSWWLNEPLTSVMGDRLVEYPFDARIAPEGLVIALVLAVGLSIIASWAASRKALRQPVRDALRVD
ncbi:MAG: FtsX-like permease family protein [Acidobacteriota bacterium]